MIESVKHAQSKIPHLPPAWADVFGEDDSGIFAECEVNGARFVWRWICPGRFRMGCDPQDEPGNSSQKPPHWVHITRGFWLGETPVIQAQWEAVMGSNPSDFSGPDRPVEKVSWQDSRDFIYKLNSLLPGLHANLPTEAQWEYGCRAGTQAAYHDGSPCTKPDGKDPALDQIGWFDENSGGETHDVKQKAANAWGLYDMHGNVWEWCRDAWNANSYASRHDGIQDPEGRDEDENAGRIVRGGSWDFNAQSCSAAFRAWSLPENRGRNLGLRMSAGQEQAKPRSVGEKAMSPDFKPLMRR